MEQTKGLSCQIPESLHARVTAERVAANQSLSEYITGLLTNYYENGGKKDMAQTRTMAFQISEDLFQRIKDYLAAYIADQTSIYAACLFGDFTVPLKLA